MKARRISAVLCSSDLKQSETFYESSDEGGEHVSTTRRRTRVLRRH